jgi:hypothetical protein
MDSSGDRTQRKRRRGASLLLIISVALALPAAAQNDPLLAKRCILAAAAKLPPIPGLTILASRTRDPTAAEHGDLDLPGVGSLAMVELDVHAAQLDATLAFSCYSDATRRSDGSSRPTEVRRVDFQSVIR